MPGWLAKRRDLAESCSRMTCADYEREHGPIWNQVIILVTGISEDAIAHLGGIRIVEPNGKVLYEQLPSGVSA